MKHKTAHLYEMLQEEKMDLVCITETYLEENDMCLSQLTSPGYMVLHQSHTTSWGGGMAIILCETFNFCRLPSLTVALLGIYLLPLYSRSGHPGKVPGGRSRYQRMCRWTGSYNSLWIRLKTLLLKKSYQYFPAIFGSSDGIQYFSGMLGNGYWKILEIFGS